MTDEEKARITRELEKINLMRPLYYEASESPDSHDVVVRVLPKDGKPLEWVLSPPWASHELCLRAFLSLIDVHKFNQAADAARGER